MNSIEILERAAEIVMEGWSQGDLAKGPNGESVPPKSELACQWCLVGSLVKAGNLAHVAEWNSLNFPTEMKEVVKAIRRETRTVSLVGWNDAPGRRQLDVVEMLHRAKWIEEMKLKWGE